VPGVRFIHGTGQDNKLSFRLPRSFGWHYLRVRLIDFWEIMPTVPQTVRALVDSLDVQHDRRQLVADTLQELGYLLDEQAGEALGAVTEAQLQHVRGAKLNVREINALLVRLKAQGEFFFHWLEGQ